MAITALGSGISARRLLTWYGVWMLALSAAFYLFPAQHMIFWSAVGASSVGAVLHGVHRHRPRRRAPWHLIAVAIALFSLGDLTYNILTDVLGQANPYPSVADALYLAMFPLLSLGAYGLSKNGAASRDRTVPLDALIVTSCLGLLWWVLLISPHVTNPDLTMPQRLVSIAYPMGDLLLLAAMSRMVSVVRFSPAVVLLSVGTVALLVADVCYGLIQIYGDWSVGGPVDIGWLVFYATWGAAALHPSMATLTEPRVVRPRPLSLRRQAVLVACALIPLGALFVDEALRDVGQGLALIVFATITLLLLLARLLGTINNDRQNMARSGRLLGTSAALVSARDVPGVTAALRGAIDQLLSRTAAHRVRVVLNDGREPELFAMLDGPGAQLCYTAGLPGRFAEGLNDFEIALACPLALAGRPTGDPYIGVALVAADEATLGFLQVPMELMASQAALAIERITLSKEIARRDSEQYFRTLIQNTADVILIVDAGTEEIRYASPSAAGMFGSIDLVSEKLLDLVDVPAGLAPRTPLELLATSAREHLEADWSITRADGSIVQTEVSCRDLRDEPSVSGLVVTLRDVTAQRGLEKELTHRAFHDALTGLANRVLFQDRMSQAVARARRTGTVAGVLFLDLDDFKVINDTLGHASGDQLLRAVGDRLRGALRPDDTAARLGGDEFAALIEDAPDPEAVEAVAARIVAALAEPFLVDGRTVAGMASVGVSTTVDAEDGHDLLRQADLALYVAKGAGKGQWRRYQPALHTAIVERLELRTALDQAVSSGDLVLEFQPIVELRNGRTAGFEALVRWNHPDRGRLMPDTFIDIAEESGLIVPIGHWVLTEALAAAAGWRELAGGDRAPYVSINVSVRQFKTPGFVQSVHDALAAADLPARSLMVEITESLLLRDDDKVWEDLAGLRETGVRIAIDDFGTGYSSLSYLRHVPLDALKMDKLFTSTIATSAKQAALVDAIISLAHTLGLDVIAEGIEDTGERDLLIEIGCPYGQGFLYARPLGYGDATQWIVAERVAV